MSRPNRPFCSSFPCRKWAGMKNASTNCHTLCQTYGTFIGMCKSTIFLDATNPSPIVSSDQTSIKEKLGFSLPYRKFQERRSIMHYHEYCGMWAMFPPPDAELPHVSCFVLDSGAPKTTPSCSPRRRPHSLLSSTSCKWAYLPTTTQNPH